MFSSVIQKLPVVAERPRASRGESIAIENGNLFMKANLVKTFAGVHCPSVQTFGVGEERLSDVR